MYKVSRLLLVLIFLLVSCTPLAPETPTTVSEFPTGRFTNGSVMIDLLEDGSLMFSDKYKALATAKYVVDDDTFSFTEMLMCNDEDAQASYHWTYKDGQLRFEVIGEDACRNGDRQIRMTAKPWTFVD